MTRHRRKSRPDVRGSHLAGVTERDRAAKVYEQQAKDKRESEPMQSNVVQISRTEPASVTRKRRGGFVMSDEQQAWLESLVSREGEEPVVSWMSGLPRARVAANGARSWAKVTLRSLRKSGASHDARGMSAYHELRENYGKPHRVDDPQIRVIAESRNENFAIEAPEVVNRDGMSFLFDGHSVRVRFVDDTTEPVFCAADVCGALGIHDASQACSRLDPDEVMSLPVQHGTRQTKALFVTEQGLYELIWGSRKQGSRDWKNWVKCEVLPSIRKTGRYEDPRRTAPALPPSPAVDYQAIATVVATTVARAMLPVMQTIKGGFDEMSTRRRQRPEHHQQQSLSTVGRQRRALEDLVRCHAGVNHFTPSSAYHDLVREKWHALYLAMLEQSNVDVLRGWSAANARGESNANGEPLSKLDWLEKSGNLALALEIALKLWG